MFITNSVLDIQQTSDAAGKRQFFGDSSNLVNNLFREREGRPATSRVARVNTTLLNVLQDRAYVALLGVAKSINVQLNSVLKKSIQVDRTIWCDVCSGLHVSNQVRVVIDNSHTTTTKNVAWADYQRVTNTASGISCLVHS